LHPRASGNVANAMCLRVDPDTTTRESATRTRWLPKHAPEAPCALVGLVERMRRSRETNTHTQRAPFAAGHMPSMNAHVLAPGRLTRWAVWSGPWAGGTSDRRRMNIAVSPVGTAGPSCREQGAHQNTSIIPRAHRNTEGAQTSLHGQRHTHGAETAPHKTPKASGTARSGTARKKLLLAAQGGGASASTRHTLAAPRERTGIVGMSSRVTRGELMPPGCHSEGRTCPHKHGHTCTHKKQLIVGPTLPRCRNID
jgi:hypothetical protein